MRRSFRPLLFTLLLMVLVLASPVFAQVAITVSFGPPPLPVYEQPLCPAGGYIWTPGYWAWDPDYGYYWVPGTWVLAPEVGYLWTPPWWGWDNGGYIFHAGYWGPAVGFYGGINYGFGYFGHGFEGGRWQGNRFFYNRSVMNVNVASIHNVYNETVVNRGVENRVSYNGGQGGITVRPTPQEEAAARERHLPPIQAQVQHRDQARMNPQLHARNNQGKPPIAATERPAGFSGHVVPAKAAGGSWHPPANAPGARQTYTHAHQLPQHAVTTRPSSGNAQLDQKYQQQEEKLAQKQNQEHQKLAQQQQRQDQRARQQNFPQPRQQQMEQRHQQQTQQMEQRHIQQTQQMQERQMGRPGGRPH